MSYNISATIDNESFFEPFTPGIWRTEPTELLDAILSGQNYSQAHYNYERTYNRHEVLREQLIAVMENRNQAYLQLLAFATKGFLDQLPEIINNASKFMGYYTNDWQVIKDAHASSNFTVDELINLEQELAIDLNDAPDAIGQYEPINLKSIFVFVGALRIQYKDDPTLQDVSFSIG